MTQTPRDPAPLPVVVVGGGLGGTATAAFLARAGVSATVLERRAGPTARPRAWIVSARSQELFRELGLDSAVRDRGSSGCWNLQVVDSLLDAPEGQDIPDPTTAVSPAGAAQCDQDVLEEILREHAVALGAEVRWESTVTDLVERGDAVEVHVADGPPLLASYVVLAEGARAGLLPCVGIASTSASETESTEFHQVLFRSPDLDHLMATRAGRAFFCPPSATIVFRRDLGRWQLQRQGRDFEDVAADVAVAVGREVDVEVLDHGSWRPTAHLADSFRSPGGRVFVVGDAAHSMPPSLGMGGNLSVADAHNLAWKLAWVLDGRAGEGLLDSYEPERRPVAELVLDESVAATRGERSLDGLVVDLGLGYAAGTSPALAGEGTGVAQSDPHELVPTIGSRLPHRWLPDGRSTLDLASATAFVTVAEPEVPGAGDDVWLLRPDGHVAARVHAADAEATTDRLLDR